MRFIQAFTHFLLATIIQFKFTYASEPHHIWYVVSHEYQESCPNDVNICHSLSHYVNNPLKYFTSNTTFVFLKGKHVLYSPLPLIINSANNLVFKSNTINKDYMSTIRCKTGSFGFSFTNSSSLIIDGLGIINCGSGVHDSGITFTNIRTVVLNNVVIKDTVGIGAKFENVTNLEIIGSTFSANGLGVTSCSLKTIQLWQSVSITAKNCEEVHYKIVNTVFNGNTAPVQLGGGLFINTVTTASTFVTIKQCTFKGITGCLATAANISVIEYKQHADIEVMDSQFSDSLRIDIPNYDTHKELDGGALKIKTVQTKQVNTSNGDHSNSIKIQNSSFSRNNATYCAGVAILVTSTSVPASVSVQNSSFFDNIAKIRAGGLCIIASDNNNQYRLHHTIEVIDSVYERNEAKDGAAVMIWPWWSGKGIYEVTVSACSFKYNVMQYTYIKPWHQILSGVLMMRWSYSGSSTGNIFILKDSSFIRNQMGPSFYLWADNAGTENAVSAIVVNCLFQENSAAIINSGIKVELTRTFKSLKISSCLFDGNEGGSGAAIDITDYMTFLRTCPNNKISLENLTVIATRNSRHAISIGCDSQLTKISISNITVLDNEATAFGSLNCALTFSGYNMFVNNTTPFGGGGLIVNGSGYAYTEPNSSIIFKDNMAALGGALYSDSRVRKQYMMMPCTFLNLNAVFVNNSATETGDNIYGGLIDICLNLTSLESYGLSLDCRELSSTVVKTSSSMSSDPYSVFLCDTGNSSIIEYKTSITNIEVYPGQTFVIPLVTAGHCYGISPGVLEVSSSGIHIISDTVSEHTAFTCKEMSYTPVQESSDVLEGTMVITVANSNFKRQHPLLVNVHLLQCPLGMEVNDNGVCMCEQLMMTDSVKCNISWWPRPIVKYKNYAGSYWLDHNKQYNCSMAYRCPFDYCIVDSDVHFNLNNETDRQCNLNRAGTLCGQCEEGLSLKLGSNACSKCSNLYLLLLVAFAMSGILIVVFFIISNLTVSVGTINGLLFYANIVKLNEAVFFPNGSIPVISQFISWINLDLGIEVCFFHGLDGYWKTWLQFVFPFYVWLLVTVIIISSGHSIRLSRYLRSNIISVLATLILMSFTKLSRTITNALMSTNLECGGHYSLVWSVDGNIKYFSLKHSILIGFSAIVLFFIVCYTFIIFTAQWLQRYEEKLCRCFPFNFMFKIQPFLDAYTGPYKVKYRYWTGMLLLVRLVITFIFIYTSGSASYVNNYVIILCEALVVLNIFNSNFYQSRINYIYEKFFHINLFCLSSMNAVVSHSSYKQYTSLMTIISVAFAMLAFVVIVSQQIFVQSCCKTIKYKQTVTLQEIQPLLNNAHIKDDYSPTEIVCRRDSIIFDVEISD